MNISIVIRTLNEGLYLGELLASIEAQESEHNVEVVIIDSGSTDETLSLAKQFDTRITFIKKQEFSFGRSLNMGCDFASGEVLAFVSGHCVPADTNWLSNLVAPIATGAAGYVYGRQIGRDNTKFSEHQVFEKYFPASDTHGNADYFCNNANAVLRRDVWQKYKFDEQITGLEDMELAQRYISKGGKVAYVPDSIVYHMHNENWSQTRRRYEREALALRQIEPRLRLYLTEALRFFFVSLLHDSSKAMEQKQFLMQFISIVNFRAAQYAGSYMGSRESRVLSRKQKRSYFYPSG